MVDVCRWLLLGLVPAATLFSPSVEARAAAALECAPMQLGPRIVLLCKPAHIGPVSAHGRRHGGRHRHLAQAQTEAGA